MTSSRGWHPNESLNIFAAEFTKKMDKRSHGKAEIVRVVMMTKKIINYTVFTFQM